MFEQRVVGGYSTWTRMKTMTIIELTRIRQMRDIKHSIMSKNEEDDQKFPLKCYHGCQSHDDCNFNTIKSSCWTTTRTNKKEKKYGTYKATQKSDADEKKG